MNKKVLLIITGILIGALSFSQIDLSNDDKTNSVDIDSTTTTVNIEQSNMMVKTALFYVLSFVKH